MIDKLTIYVNEETYNFMQRDQCVCACVCMCKSSDWIRYKQCFCWHK